MVWACSRPGGRGSVSGVYAGEQRLQELQRLVLPSVPRAALRRVLVRLTIAPRSHRQYILQQFNMWHQELPFVELLLEEDIRNNSAWNHRPGGPWRAEFRRMRPALNAMSGTQWSEINHGL